MPSRPTHAMAMQQQSFKLCLNIAHFQDCFSHSCHVMTQALRQRKTPLAPHQGEQEIKAEGHCLSLCNNFTKWQTSAQGGCY